MGHIRLRYAKIPYITISGRTALHMSDPEGWRRHECVIDIGHTIAPHVT